MRSIHAQVLLAINPPVPKMSDTRACDLLCADNVLNKTSQLMPILKAIENPKAEVPSLLFQCQHGFQEVRIMQLVKSNR